MSLKRVLLTGANGLLGQKLAVLLDEREKLEIIATSKGQSRLPHDLSLTYESIDITDFDRLQYLFQQFQPTEVINTAAMTNVDACEQDPEACYKANVQGVRFLCGLCKEYNTRLIHVSTDFIFDGLAGPYDERAIPNPLSVYGRAKWEAEQLIQSSGINAAIARTILLYGMVPGLSRTNIVLWVRDSLLQNKTIRVVDDQFRSPTLVEDLADGIAAILFRNKTGIYHLSGPEIFSVFELALQVADFWGLDVNLIEPIKTKDLGQPAARPPKTGFVILKAQTDLGYTPHTLTSGLTILKRQIDYWAESGLKS